MTDVKAWLEERRGIHANAELKARVESDRGTIYTAWTGAHDSGGLPEDDREHIADSYAEGAEAITDALNMFPRALTALEAVIELHKPVPIYDVESGDCEHGEDCVGIEIEPSETYCPDHIDYYSCECMMDASSPDEFPEYPCPTVQAIEGAINE